MRVSVKLRVGVFKTLFMKTVTEIFILTSLLFSSIFLIEGKTLEAIYFILVAIFNNQNNKTTINK